jgi:hypothetical protein
MYVDHFSHTNKNKRLERIFETIRQLSGVDYSFLKEFNYEQLENMYAALSVYRQKIVNESQFNSYYADPEYAINSLLTEALRIVLSEWTPPSKRRRRPRRKTNETANYIVFSKDGVPVHSQADAGEAERAMDVWDDPSKERMPTTYAIQGDVHDLLDPEYVNPVEELERDWPIEDEIDTVDGEGLPTAAEIGRWQYPENVEDSEASPGAEEHKAKAYVQAEHPEQTEIGEVPRSASGRSGYAFADPSIDQSWINENRGEKQMANRNKLKKYEALIERKQSVAQKLRKLKEQRERRPKGIGTLLEGDLERAELILAAKDTTNKLQDMAEDLAKMQVEDLYPLVDNIKGEFGPDLAETFEQTVNEQLGNALETIRAARESVNNATLRLEGKLSDEDLASSVGNDMAQDTGEEGDDLELDMEMDDEESGVEGELELDFDDDDFGGAEAGEGPEDEPLGRAKKESANRRGNRLAEGADTYSVLFKGNKISQKYPKGVKVQASSPDEAHKKARDKVKKEFGHAPDIHSVGKANKSNVKEDTGGKQMYKVHLDGNNRITRKYPNGFEIDATSEEEAIGRAKEILKLMYGGVSAEKMVRPTGAEPINENAQTENLKKGQKVKITGGDHKGKTGTIKTADVRGKNSLVTVNGDDEYIPTQHIQTMNEGRKKVAEQDEQKSFDVWGRVDIKQDTKNRKFTDIKAKTREEAKEKALEMLRSEARKNKQGSVKSAVVSKVQENK